MDRSRPSLFTRHAQPRRETVDGDHALGAEQVRALDGELTDGSAAPHGDDVAPLDLAVLNRHVARWQDVRKEQHLLVRYSIRNFERTHVGERYTRVFGLPSGIAAEHVRVPEDACRRMPPQFLRHPGVRVRVLTEREPSALTGKAVAACDRKWNDHAVADP